MSAKQMPKTPLIYGYEIIETIFESAKSIVYRARRASDDTFVVLKVLHESLANEQEIARYQSEFDLLERCRSPLVIKAYALETYGTVPFLVLEDIGGVSLSHYKPYENLTVNQKLKISIQLATALSYLHHAGVIHKDINPANIIYNSKREAIRIIDFGIAERTEKAVANISLPERLEGSLAYISPEQTGRMNRSVDYRTDLYSLGVTLYELFTKKLPFPFEDKLKVIHYHLAKHPKPPSSVSEDVPIMVSKIIQKLLSKAPEDRYHSALGLRYDLKLCLEQLEKGREITDFSLGLQDISFRFMLPEKLYGRKKEVSSLLRAFDRVCEGKEEVVVIGGPNGVGKTSLVREIYKPITERRGYFISGHFDELKQNIPYNGLLSAFSDLISQMLSEPESKLKNWRKKMMDAIGPSGRLLLDVVPDLEKLLGPFSELPELDSAEAIKNRFNLVFKNFLQSFSQPEHPLVLFLDDIQWIDKSSAHLLSEILDDKASSYLLLICAHKYDHHKKEHPLKEAFSQFKNTKVSEILLSPLGLSQVNAFLSEALYCNRDVTLPLAKVAAAKTSGNPFFLGQFLKTLMTDNLLWFSPEKAGWHWDISAIENSHITDNVVDLLASKIGDLKKETQKTLQVACAIGHRFDQVTLQEVCPFDPKKVVDGLKDAIAMGIIAMESASQAALDSALAHKDKKIYLHFVHDRFRQATYEQISKEDKPYIHRRIGRYLLSQHEKDENSPDNTLFEIAFHLNLSPMESLDEASKIALMDINLEAGQKALQASAYESALVFFKAAISYAKEDAWQEGYERMLLLYTKGAEAAYLSGEADTLKKYVKEVEEKGKNLVDKIRAIEISIYGAVAENRLLDAARLGKETLGGLGSPLPKKVHVLHVAVALLKTSIALAMQKDKDHVQRGPMTDKLMLLKINFQFSLAQSLYFTEPLLIPLLVCDALRSSIKYGNAPVSSYIYSCYGMLMAAIFRDYDKAVRFGLLGVKIFRKTKDRRFEAPLLVSYNVFIRHWTEPLSKTLAQLERGFQSGLEMGDQEFATHAGMAFCYHSFFAGRYLSLVAGDIERYSQSIEKMNQKGGVYLLSLFRGVCYNLTTKKDRPAYLDGEPYHLLDMEKQHIEAKDTAGIFAGRFCQMLLHFIFGKYDKALECAKIADKHALSSEGTVFTASFRFYQTLTLIKSLKKASFLEKFSLKRKIRQNLKLLKKWAKVSPANHMHRFLMVQAELLRLKGKGSLAQKYSDQAAKIAKRHAHLMDLAVIYEACALYHLGKDSMVVASAYLRKARNAYNRWGAKTKAERLDALYPFLAESQPAGLMATTTQTASSVSSTTIDVATLKLALMAIAEEKVHSKMIEKIVLTSLQFAGATRGVLLLRKDSDFFVEADGSVDKEIPVIFQSQPFEECENIPHPVIHYVKNTGNYLVVDDARIPVNTIPGLSRDDYVRKNSVKSVLCIPLTVGAGSDMKVVGILYLENIAASSVFTEQRVEVLEIICLAAAGRLELSLKAATDGLTGLYNHEYFKNFLTKELLQSRRQLRHLSLIMVDIDHFKQFNDNHGHQVGDLVLKKVALAIQTVCRGSDIIARYGGEEISVILPETDAHKALMIAERIRTAIYESSIEVDGLTLKVTASLGVSSLGDNIANSEALLKEADEALYRSKKEGRNRVTQAGAKDHPGK